MNSIQKNLTRIGHLNHRLADELVKLPETTDIISDSSQLALENLLQIYRFAPDRFDHMFACMDAIGLPAHRNYCSPLQALFWLLQDEKLKSCGLLLGLNIAAVPDVNGDCQPELLPATDTKNLTGESADYTLEKILDAAWKDESNLMPDSKVHQIIQRIQVEAEAEQYAQLETRHTDLQLQGCIMDDFLTKKEIFNVKDWDTIEKAVAHSRWTRKAFGRSGRIPCSPTLSRYVG